MKVFFLLNAIAIASALTRHSLMHSHKQHGHSSKHHGLEDNDGSERRSSVHPETGSPKSMRWEDQCAAASGQLTEMSVRTGGSSRLCYYMYVPEIASSPAMTERALTLLGHGLAGATTPATTTTTKPPVLIVNGIGDYAYTFYSLAETLRRSGHVVVTFDHLNRGYSESIDKHTAFDYSLYKDELLLLLTRDPVTAPIFQTSSGFTLIGYSMGGAISIAFAKDLLTDSSLEKDFKLRLNKLVLLGPAGFFQAPMHADKIMKVLTDNHWFGLAALLLGSKYPVHKDFVTLDKMSDVVKSVEVHQDVMYDHRDKEFKRSMASSIGSFKQMFNIEAEASELKRLHVGKFHILVILGESDVTVPTDKTLPGVKDKLLETSNHDVVKVIKATKHAFVIEQAKTTNSIISHFVDDMPMPEEYRVELITPTD